MTVLVVDDQINVVSGIISGIHWEALGIRKVLKAYNAYEAREQLAAFPIDVVLCDIEMPVENGLSLCAWAREAQMETEFIFLTAHADFLYAKEVIRLGGFDYILQPARYEDIEKALLGAMDKVRVKKKTKAIEGCNEVFRQQKSLLLDRLFKSWLMESGRNYAQIRVELEKLGVVFMEGRHSFLCLVNLQNRSGVMAGWEDSLMLYTITNVVEELFSYYGCKALCCQLSWCDYAFYIYAEGDGRLEAESADRQFHKLTEVYKKYFEERTACYIAQLDRPDQLPEAFVRLREARNDNVGALNGVFWGGEGSHPIMDEKQIGRYGEEWEKLLQNKMVDSFCEDARYNLRELCRKRQMNADILGRYYQEFMRVVYLTADRMGFSSAEIFENSEDMEKACRAYASVDSMEWLIGYINGFFNEAGASEAQQRTQTDEILQYIRSNLDNNIKRTDIAQAVHLNPNYVSRLFKSAVGIPLKEYILTEKMKLARHMVRETALPISVIAMKVGYSNFSHFTQTYKKMTGGVTPAEDRERCKKEGMVHF